MVVGTISGGINPVTARYVARVLDDAEADRATAVVFVIDTPGGLIDSTYAITGRLLNARVPVVTFVGPAGARAASAGAFIVLAGHVATMAPTTNIGAAHPVTASGGDIEGDLRLKAENDAAAKIRGIAEARGRDAAWAEDAVRKSVSIGADEAVRRKVVDFIATDVADLVAKLDGRTVALPQGPVVLQTKGAPLDDFRPNPLEGLLHFLVDPQIAVLLFTLGTYGLIFELSNPSLIFPGVAGVIAIVLALFAFGTLDASATGIALMAFALLLFALEIKVASQGILTAGGIVALTLGTIVVFPPLRPTFPGVRWAVEPAVMVAITGTTALFFGLALRASARYQRLPAVRLSGVGMGAGGIARTDIAENGVAAIGGEEWSATSAAGLIPRGAPVQVRSVDGLRVTVVPGEPSARERET